MGRHRHAPGPAPCAWSSQRPRPHTPDTTCPSLGRAAAGRNPRRRHRRSATHHPAKHIQAPLPQLLGRGLGVGADRRSPVGSSTRPRGFLPPCRLAALPPCRLATLRLHPLPHRPEDRLVLRKPTLPVHP